MGNLSEKIAAEKENIEKALYNLNGALEKANKSPLELAGMATFLHNIYNGTENILMQILKYKTVKIKKSEGWHKELLNLATSQSIITEELSAKLYEYLTFRHYFIHSYGFTLDEDELNELAKNLPNIWEQFISEIRPYL